MCSPSLVLTGFRTPESLCPSQGPQLRVPPVQRYQRGLCGRTPWGGGWARGGKWCTYARPTALAETPPTHTPPLSSVNT